MQILTSTISSQGQVTIPVEVRKQLELVAGGVVLWQVIPSKQGLPQVSLMAGTPTQLGKVRGIGKQFYATHGGGQSVIEKERNSWDD